MIIADHEYLCIRSVVMNDGEIDFTEGFVYDAVERGGGLVNDHGEDHWITSGFARKYFIDLDEIEGSFYFNDKKIK